jgi:hypothetical protein
VPILLVLRTTDDSPKSFSHMENETRRIVGATPRMQEIAG